MSKQTFPTGAQIAGDLGGTSASPQVTGAHFGGSDGQYMIRRSGLWAPATPAYTDLSGIPASFTPSAHASTHDPGGSDAIKDLTRLVPGPSINGYTTEIIDVALASGGSTPLAGVVFLEKIQTAHAYTINTIDLSIKQAGTGATALANCFVGIYDSGGTRRFVSADQASNWATTGNKSISVAGGYTVTALDFVYIAVLVGTQSTTNVQLFGFAVNATAANSGLTAATYRFAQQLTGQSSLPSSLTLSSNAITTAAPSWFGVK